MMVPLTVMRMETVTLEAQMVKTMVTVMEEMLMEMPTEILTGEIIMVNPMVMQTKELIMEM